MKEADILKDRGYKSNSDLPFCTNEGIEYFIGYHSEDKTKAAIVAMINNDDQYLLTKETLREMAAAATTYGIKTVWLYTNYGVELHSKFETPTTVGLYQIMKIDKDGFNHK